MPKLTQERTADGKCAVCGRPLVTTGLDFWGWYYAYKREDVCPTNFWFATNGELEFALKSCRKAAIEGDGAP